jgi:hypothetical protein
MDPLSLGIPDALPRGVLWFSRGKQKGTYRRKEKSKGLREGFFG